MSFSLSLVQTLKEGSVTLDSTTSSKTVQGHNKINETVADGETDWQVAFSIDVSSLKIFYMVSDQAITVETNDGSSPQETFSLAANVPVVWQEGETAIFSGDVTDLFITNSSGSAATLKVHSGTDTPAT